MYKELARSRSSSLIVYITGDRPGMETNISSDVYDKFVDHLDRIGVVQKISLYLYTRGGDPLTAWSLVNLIRQFCEEFEVVLPSKAQSAGTLISLGSNRIVMTKQATLGPIDPSISGPLNPQIPGASPDARAPVSVEAVNGYLEMAKSELGLHSESSVGSVLTQLAEKIHPLVLGTVFRSKSQIQMLARKLLSAQVTESDKVEKIISFLCSKSGSHDYVIHRREARDGLGLKIEKPDAPLYALVKRIYDDIALELCLNSRFDVGNTLAGAQQAQYTCRRALIETLDGGTDVYVSEGCLQQRQIQATPTVIQTAFEDRRTFEGWRHEN